MRAGITVVICSRGGSDAGGGDVTFSTPSIGYRQRTVQWLAEMHLSLDHDQYLDLPDVKA